MLVAAQAGADVVDVAVDSMSGMTSQPLMVLPSVVPLHLQCRQRLGGHLLPFCSRHYDTRIGQVIYRSIDTGMLLNSSRHPGISRLGSSDGSTRRELLIC